MALFHRRTGPRVSHPNEEDPSEGEDLPPPPDSEYQELCQELLGGEGSSQMYRNLKFFSYFHFKICNFIHTIWFERDAKTGLIKVYKNRARVLFAGFQLFLQWAYMLTTTAYFVGTIKYNRVSGKLLALCFLAAWYCCGLMSVDFWKKRFEMEGFYKAILQFENRYLPVRKAGQKVKLDKICKLLMGLGLVSSFGLPGMMIVMLLVDPCRPPHLGYVFFKQGLDQCIVPGWGVQMLVLAADVYLWVIALTHGEFYVFQGLLVGVRTQDFYLRLLRSGLKRSLSFSGKKKDEICLRVYRELHILNRLYNNVFRPVFFPNVIVTGMTVAVFGMLACLKMRHLIPFPAIMFFPIIAVDGLSIIFIAKIAAVAYLQSVGFMESAGKRPGHLRKGTYHRTLKSMDKIKIRFGGNFVDGSTPIVFLDFVMGQTVQLMLLMDKKH